MIIGTCDTRKDVFIVAEIGNNHEGNFDVAAQLVYKAAECGVSAVKFQTFKTEYFVSGSDKARFERLKSFELTNRQFEQLAQLAKSLGIAFISTPLDLASAEFLAGIVDGFKIASSDNNFYPLLDKVASFGKPLIVSTGLSGLEDVRSTIQFVTSKYPKYRGADLLAVLHCVTSYPVPPEEASLRSIPFLAERLECTIGYSDHTIGTDAALLATALGARIIEKHFTLSKSFSSFRDHQLSADPADMLDLVTRIRRAAQMLGASEKAIQACEQPNATAVKRSIVAARHLPAGHQLTETDLAWIRPGGGLAPGEEHRLLNKTLNRAVDFGEQIHLDDVTP